MLISLHVLVILGLLLAASAGSVASAADPAACLRLSPFPRAVRISPGGFRLRTGLRLRLPTSSAIGQAGADLAAEIRSATGLDCTVEDGGPRLRLQLLASGTPPSHALRAPDHPEGYTLTVGSGGVAGAASDERGLLWALQTLRQLVRANLRGRTIPGLVIEDYPALRYRGTQTDITRGPSPLPASMRRAIELSAYLRMNFHTTYLEHQFEHPQHPLIGPKDGSMTGAELSALVAYAGARGVEIIGNQQSFGHFGNILQHPAYAALRETPDILLPGSEESYRLLTDLYADQAPLLTSKLFNVCCDETYGLGAGPSRPVAEKIGVGGVYARHINRVHDILRDRFGKRMMMWGDILLQHPDHIADVPRDTVLLAWGYDARASFDDTILPFSKSGFEFFICPGVNNWSRILPDFAVTRVNVQNYVRDGVRLGAMGMLNTVWDDDGETLFAPNWHGAAWGAECAWSGSTTPYDAYMRRIGGVLFGERGDHFGRAIGLLSRTHSMPASGGMMNGRFWQADASLTAGAERQAKELLVIVEPALRHLRAARADARANADLLDHFIFGAERMRVMAWRAQELLAAGRAVTVGDLPGAAARVTAVRDAHATLRREAERLWRSEKKPYALAAVLARYDRRIAGYDAILARLSAARAGDGSAGAPSAGDLGLPGAAGASGRAFDVARSEEKPGAALAWAVTAASARFLVGLSGPSATTALPVILPLAALPAGVEMRTVRLFELHPDGRQVELPCQPIADGPDSGVASLLPGRAGGTAARQLVAYAGGRRPQSGAVAAKRLAGGGVRVENGALGLSIGREGGHIYRWEVTALQGRDITEPGDAGWAGFADITGPHRSAPNRLQVVSAGPVLARVRCLEQGGLRKTLDIWAGQDWVDCRLDAPTQYFACFDDVALMGATSGAPGVYLFSDGKTGPLRPLTASTECQDRRDGQTWSAKYRRGGALIALATPETATLHLVGPGGGMGGVVTEGGAAASHFVMLGGVCPEDPGARVAGLAAALDLRTTVRLSIGAVELR